MAEDEGEEETTFELTAAAYPDLDEVSLSERRRVWVLSFILAAGKGSATPKSVIADAKALEDYLTGTAPALKVVMQ